MLMQERNSMTAGSQPRAGGRNHPNCPRCERAMTVKQVTPLLFASDLDEVVFGCSDCGTEAKRTVKRG
jgi:hypothetical protein